MKQLLRQVWCWLPPRFQMNEHYQILSQSFRVDWLPPRFQLKEHDRPLPLLLTVCSSNIFCYQLKVENSYVITRFTFQHCFSTQILIWQQLYSTRVKTWVTFGSLNFRKQRSGLSSTITDFHYELNLIFGSILNSLEYLIWIESSY